MVLYAVLAEASVGRLFMGGLLPGVIMAGTLMIMVFWYAKRRDYPRSPRPTKKVLWQAFKDAFWSLMAPVLLFGGIVSGVFTPTEAAVFAAFYSLILGLFVYKEFSIKDLPRIILATVETNGVVLALVMTAVMFGWSLSVANVPQILASGIMSVSNHPVVILLLINAFLLFVGMFMEANAAIMILTPIFIPLMHALGVSPTQFGIMMILNLMIGLLTPPVGIVLYVVSNIAKVSFERVTKATIPFLIPLIAVLLLITLIPGITTWIPNLLFGPEL